MARYTGPKNKLSRKEGIDLFNKGVKLRRATVPPGVHGPKSTRRRKISEYGTQLREKQKVKRFYGILEKQFKHYYEKATKQPGTTGEILLQLLERRLDNFLVRSNLCPTRAMSRQIIVHNHILVNGKKVNRPSYQLKPGQIVTLGNKSITMPAIVALLNNKELTTPKWIKRKAAASLMERLPERSDISEEFSEQTIVESYSR